MNKIKSLLIISFVTIGIISCDNELVDKEISQNSTNFPTIKNGRLSFQSKEEFVKKFQELADAEENVLYNYFQPLYEKGFYSLRPIVTEKNEDFLYEHYLKIIKTNDLLLKNSNRNTADDGLFDYLDDLEEIVGDDVFAAFLNNEAEILIADDVYKYTDVGLFISKEDKYNILQDYLDVKSISKEIEIPTSESAKLQFYNEVPCGGMNQTYQLTADLEYFSETPCNGGGGYSGGGGSYNPTPGSVTASDPSYSTFINNLGNCTPHSGLFGNLFGDNNVCIDKYESRRRVKTKAFNYNYFLVYHLGVKCKHQYKGWTGFWRTEATDEIRLVVEAAQFQYDLDALTGNTAINNQTKERIYFMNNQKILYQPNTMTLPNWGAPSTTYFNMNSLPPIFHDNLSFEFFSTGWDWLDSQIQNGIDSNLKASKLNEYFYNGLYNTVTSQLQSALGNSVTPPANRTFVAKFPEQGKLIFQKSVLNQGFGIGIRQKTFDWGAEFSFSASTSGNSGWRMSGGAGNILVRPTNFRVKIIGAARRGSAWHGSKFNVGIN